MHHGYHFCATEGGRDIAAWYTILHDLHTECGYQFLLAPQEIKPSDHPFDEVVPHVCSM